MLQKGMENIRKLLSLNRMLEVFLFTMILGSAAVLTVSSGNTEKEISDIIYFLTFSVFLLSYGFTINSYADYEQDRISKRDKQYFNKNQYLYAAIIFGIISIILVFPLLTTQNSIIIAFCMYGLGTVYSLKPIRLKERGVIAIIASSLSLVVLEYLLLFSNDLILFNYIMAGWLFIFILIVELSQQIKDLNNDRLSKTNTFALKLGIIKSKYLLLILIGIFTMYIVFTATLGLEFIWILPMLIPCSMLTRYIHSAII